MTVFVAPTPFNQHLYVDHSQFYVSLTSI